jgi:hypothetical protein
MLNKHPRVNQTKILSSMRSTRRLQQSPGRDDIVKRCCALLAREKFTVSLVVSVQRSRGPRPPDLIAAKGLRLVRVFALSSEDIDATETRDRIRTAHDEGETLVCVPWPLKWRALSNIDRWGLRGVAVTGL